MTANCACGWTEKILINNDSPSHIKIVDGTDHSHNMRQQRIHDRDHADTWYKVMPRNSQEQHVPKSSGGGRGLIIKKRNRKRHCARHAKKFRSEEKTSREERRDSLETRQIENPHFTGGKVKQKHKIFNIHITILAKKTAKKHWEVVGILKIGDFTWDVQRNLKQMPKHDLREVQNRWDIRRSRPKLSDPLHTFSKS